MDWITAPIVALAALEASHTPARYSWRTTLEAVGWYSLRYLTAPAIAMLQLPAFQLVASHAVSSDMGWISLILLDDFSQYWSHRLSHRLKWWWAFHRAHHSSKTYNLLLALRNSPAEAIPMTVFLCIPLILGYPLTHVLICRAASIFGQHLMHTQTNFRWPGWIKAVVVHPQYHELHHASNPCYWDKNFGALLCIWDRAFRTSTRRSEPPVYGIQ